MSAICLGTVIHHDNLQHDPDCRYSNIWVTISITTYVSIDHLFKFMFTVQKLILVTMFNNHIDHYTLQAFVIMNVTHVQGLQQNKQRNEECFMMLWLLTKEIQKFEWFLTFIYLTSFILIITLFERPDTPVCYHHSSQISTHLPAVTTTLSTATVMRAPRDLGPRARNINRKSLSTFLKVTWARTQVSKSGLSCLIVTFPGFPRYGQARTDKTLSLPSEKSIIN